MEHSETPQNMAEAFATAPPLGRGMRLAKLAATHFGVWLLVFSLFAAADSWSQLTGLGIASLLSAVTGAIAGVVTVTLVHEWFHYLGARFSGGRYDIPGGLGLFVYDWDFGSNSRSQFFFMSIAGTVGGVVALVLLWQSIPNDSFGRAALHGGAIAGFVFGAWIEWPVLKRTRDGGEPLVELSKINERVLANSVTVSLLAGLVLTLLVAP